MIGDHAVCGLSWGGTGGADPTVTMWAGRV